jgi:hypothetical protein
MRGLWVRGLNVTCLICRHDSHVDVDAYPDHVQLPSFGSRMVRTRCGIIGADARPNWREQPKRPSLTGAQWTGRP